ncbi:GNAT family N-acetyltransferase [Exiguobacterium indicum]
MNMIQLVPVTAENWEACCELTLTAEQQDFMEANVYSIAQAKFEPSLVLRAIIAGEAVVGFVMYNTELEELNGYWIYRIMIDQAQQGNGIGRLAMQAVIDEMRVLSAAKRIVVGYRPDNQAAHRLYASLGFIDHGDRFGREMAVRLEV